MKLATALFLVFFGLSFVEATPIPKLNSTLCGACNLLTDVISGLLLDQPLDYCLADVVAYMCWQLKIEDQFVCNGIINSFQDDFLYVLQKIINRPGELCALLIEDCGDFFNPWTWEWTLRMPGIKPPKKQLAPPDPNAPKLKILHLSDIHIDSQYVAGTEALCSEPSCCRTPNNTHDFAQEAIHLPAGYWGTEGHCETPYRLLENLLQFISKNHTDLDYVLVTGDLESSADWDYKRNTHQEYVKNISRLFEEYFPTIPVYFAVGNHEGVPVDNFAPHFTPSKFHMDWLYDTMADSWKSWIPEGPNGLDLVKFNGCYMKKIYPGLRLISLNNILGDPMNFYLYINQTDPDGTMTWLIDQLAEAEYYGDKVQIIAHVPPGESEAFESWSMVYYTMVNRFEDTIVGQYFGHTHKIAYKMFYEDPNDHTSRPTSVLFAAASVVPEDNPTYRIYTIDGNYEGSTYQTLDYGDYYANITLANLQGHPSWVPIFTSVRQEYSLGSMYPEAWNDLILRMEKNDTLFNLYFKNYFRSNLKTWNLSTKQEILCQLRTAHHNEQQLCSDIDALKSFKAKKNQKLYSKNKKAPERLPTRDEILEGIKEVGKTLKFSRKDGSKCSI